MRRLILYTVLALLLAAGLAWMADHPGLVTIDWQGWRLETSFTVLVFLAAGVLFTAMGIQALIAKARRDLPFVGANRHLRRQRKGLSHLNRAAIALAVGEASKAEGLLRKAERLLPPQPLTHLIAAQAKLSAGNIEGAQQHFEALLKDPEAEFLGVRGLLTAALRSGREDEALQLSARAEEMAPKSGWALETRFRLLARAGEWPAAADVLVRLIKRKTIDPATSDRWQAATLYLQAHEADLAGHGEEALKLAVKATKADRRLVPAAVLAARLARAAGKKAFATRIMKAAWKEIPHPDLAEAFQAFEVGETPRERYRRFKKLVAADSDHPLGRILLAEHALAAEHVDEAVTLLQPLLRGDYAAQANRLMAEVERARGGPDAEERAAVWLGRIGGPSPEPLWICGNCGEPAAGWSHHCHSCKAFASLEWKEVGDGQRPETPAEAEQPLITLLPEALEDSAEGLAKVSPK